MMLTLTRTQSIPDGTFGLLRIGALELRTMEDDWRDNAPGVSCIPAGAYVLRRTVFHKHNLETFEVTGVAGRSRILIHPANTEEDVEGCIGVGMRIGSVMVAKDEDTGETRKLKQAVVESQAAFHRFMEAMAGQDVAQLEVRWASGLPPLPR